MAAQSVFTKTITSGNSLATFDLGQSWLYTYAVIPTMTSQSATEVWASTDGGTTFYQVRQPVAQTTTAQMNSYVIAATCAAGGSIVPIPSFRFIRLRMADSAATTPGVTYQIIGSAGY